VAKYGYTLDSPEVPFVPDLPAPFLTIIAGRGCKYNCNFCQPAERHIFGRKVRKRSPANIVAELKILRERYHFASFMFHDDCLTENGNGFGVLRPVPGRRFTQPFCQSALTSLLKRGHGSAHGPAGLKVIHRL
jgi:radical SAM superfamily enzyme YgiQ (UPF0313 family)